MEWRIASRADRSDTEIGLAEELWRRAVKHNFSVGRKRSLGASRGDYR